MTRFAQEYWALILGGSSGFGLASARKLSAEGMNVCVVHRDRRGAMERINREFDEIRANGRGFFSLNLDALTPEGMTSVLEGLESRLGSDGKVRVLLHSIAFGNLKPVAAAKPPASAPSLDRLADALGAADAWGLAAGDADAIGATDAAGAADATGLGVGIGVRKPPPKAWMMRATIREGRFQAMPQSTLPPVKMAREMM